MSVPDKHYSISALCALPGPFLTHDLSLGS